MNKHASKNRVKKSGYAKPELRVLGSVRGLTLKVGSLTDSGQAGQFN